jgi:hypothetical protein
LNIDYFAENKEWGLLPSLNQALIISLPFPKGFLGLLPWIRKKLLLHNFDGIQSSLMTSLGGVIFNETLQIINKPKHPKEGEYKEQNGRTHAQEDKRTT